MKQYPSKTILTYYGRKYGYVPKGLWYSPSSAVRRILWAAQRPTYLLALTSIDKLIKQDSEIRSKLGGCNEMA